jgi:methylmalonyl-CoA carboxyltransferase large subunit
MSDPPQNEMRSVVDELRRQLAQIAAQLAQLERAIPLGSPAGPIDVAPPSASNGLSAQAAAAVSSDRGVVQETPQEELSEETLIAISAAVAAFLGERAHVRQIRLISSAAWGQQGRVSIQGSHRLDR